MQKATLTGRQRGAAISAGIFGHLLFVLGWYGLGFVLLGAGISAILTGGASGVGGLIGDPEGFTNVLDGARGVLGGVTIVLGILAVIFLVLGFFVSGWILKSGGVRKPWGTTTSAIIIAAIIDVPLFFAYLVVAANITDTRVAGPVFLGPLIALVGTILVGILIWLWMAWARRGYTSQFEGIAASGASSVAATPSAATLSAAKSTTSASDEKTE